MNPNIKQLSSEYLRFSPDSKDQLAWHALTYDDFDVMDEDDAIQTRWDSKTNLVKECEMSNKYRYRKAHQVVDYLKTKYQATHQTNYIYTGLITFDNIRYNGLTPAHFQFLKAVAALVRDYFNGDSLTRYKGQKRLKRGLMMLTAGIEDTFFTGMRKHRIKIHNLHDQMIFTSDHDLKINPNTYTLWHDLNNYLHHYINNDITVSIRPLINERRAKPTPVVVNRATTESDWKAVEYTCLYTLKQRKLPLPHKDTQHYKHGKSDIKAFSNYKYNSEALASLLEAIPRGFRFHYFPRLKGKTTKYRKIIINRKRNCKLAHRIMNTLDLHYIPVVALVGANGFTDHLKHKKPLPFKFTKYKPPP